MQLKKLLFNRESPEIQPLRELVQLQTHLTLVMWAIDCAPPVLELFEERCVDERPRQALEAAKLWARGQIKMPAAKKAAHAAHNAATAAEHDPAACAAARAMGHVVGTVHVETHALGLVFYGLTAFVYAAPADNAERIVREKLQWFYDRLLWWQQNINKEKGPFAQFLMLERPNKEKLLKEKSN